MLAKIVLKSVDLLVNVLAVLQRLLPLDDLGHALDECVHQLDL